MPNGQIQVGQTATNPQTGKKIRWDGKAWQPVQPGILSSMLDELKSQIPSMKSVLPNRGNLYGMENPGGPLYPAIQLRNEIMNWERRKNEGYGVPYRVLAAVPESAGIPTGAQGMEEAAKQGNWRGVIGHALTPALEAGSSLLIHGPAERGMESVGKVSRDPLENIQSKLQGATVSQWEIEQARLQHDQKLSDLETEYQRKIEQTGKKTVEDEAAYKTKVEQAKDDYARKVAAANQKRIDVSAQSSGAETKRKTFQQPRSGPVYQRIKGMADQVAQRVAQLDKTVRSAYNARYNAFRAAMVDSDGNPLTANLEPVQQAVVDAQENILKGSPESIAVFKNLLKEGEDPLLSQASVFRGAGKGVDVKDVLSSMKSEGERSRFLRSLGDQQISVGEDIPSPKEGATIPVDDLQGYSTELGNKIYRSASLPGDVRRALKYVKDASDKEITRIAESKKMGGVKRQLDRDWAEYMGDFYDSDGALHKLKNALNSDNRIAMLSGGEGARIIDSLGHYARFDPDIATVGRVRSLVKQLRELPSSAGASPGEVPRPKFPERPEPRSMPEAPKREPFSTKEYRKQHIHRIAEGLHKITGWDVASIGYALEEIMGGKPPWALSYPLGKRLLAKLLTHPGVIEYLSKELPNVPKGK